MTVIHFVIEGNCLAWKTACSLEFPLNNIEGTVDITAVDCKVCLKSAIGEKAMEDYRNAKPYVVSMCNVGLGVVGRVVFATGRLEAAKEFLRCVDADDAKSAKSYRELQEIMNARQVGISADLIMPEAIDEIKERCPNKHNDDEVAFLKANQAQVEQFLTESEAIGDPVGRIQWTQILDDIEHRLEELE